MEQDRINQDGNLIGRLGALLVIAVAVVGLGRVCGVTASLCPMSSSKMCPFSSSVTPAAPAAVETPAEAPPPSAEPAPKH